MTRLFGILQFPSPDAADNQRLGDDQHDQVREYCSADDSECSDVAYQI